MVCVCVWLAHNFSGVYLNTRGVGSVLGCNNVSEFLHLQFVCLTGLTEDIEYKILKSTWIIFSVFKIYLPLQWGKLRNEGKFTNSIMGVNILIQFVQLTWM